MRISIAVIVIAVFASVTPAEAHCTWRHPGHCLKGGVQDLGKIAAKSVDVLGKGTEVIVKEIPVVGAPAAEIIGAVREDVVEVIEETPVTVIEETGEVLEEFAEETEETFARIGRKTGVDNIDDLGAKLGTVGMAVGSVVAGAACTTATLGGCLPVVVGGVVGSGVGSLLDGEPSAHVGVHAPTSPPDQQQVPPRAIPNREPSSKLAVGTALQLVPEIFEWFGILNLPLQWEKFEQDRMALAGQVPVGKTVDAWVLVQGNEYRAMTLNPGGFWIGPGHDQHRIEIIGSMDVRVPAH